MLQVIGPENECAKHGKEFMHFFEYISSSIIIESSGLKTEHIIRRGTWVCRKCTGEKYFSELQSLNSFREPFSG